MRFCLGRAELEKRFNKKLEIKVKRSRKSRSLGKVAMDILENRSDLLKTILVFKK